MDHTTMPTAPPLRRNRDYHLLWTAHALSAFGSQASYIALPLVLLAQTHSAADFGIVTFAEALFAVLAGLPAGLLVDRLSRKAVMVGCDLGRALTFTALTAAVLAHRVSLPLALAVALGNSVLSAPFSPAASATLRNVVPPGQLTTALSLSQARAAGATLLGPLLGAALYAVAPALPFAADAASYLASAVCIGLLRLPRRRRPAVNAPAPSPERALLRELTAGLTEIRRSPFLRYTLANAALVNFAFGGIVLTLMTQGADSGSGPVHNSVIIATSGIGSLLGALTAARAGRAFAPRALVLTVCWSTALLTPLLAVPAPLPFTATVTALCCLAPPAANTVITAARLSTVPDELQGRVQSACTVLPALIVPFGPLASGLLLDHLPAGAVLLANAAILLLLAIVSTTSAGLRRIPDLREPSRPTGSRTPSAVA